MADISKITLPSGTTYNIKDTEARQLIEMLNSYGHYEGVTTTALTDGATTNPIVIASKEVTAKTGSIVNYNKKEFIFNGSAWQEFGDLSGLKALAYKASASGSYTPAGGVSQPTFTGTAGTVSGSGEFTPAGTVSQPTFTGTEGSVSTSASYTPAGSVTVTPNTTSVYSMTGVGSLPSLTTTVENEVLTIGFSQGSLPTRGAATTVATGIKSASFSGTAATVSGSGKFTPSGTVSKPTFTGSKGSVSTSATYTPVGTVSKPTFNGTKATITVS